MNVCARKKNCCEKCRKTRVEKRTGLLVQMRKRENYARHNRWSQFNSEHWFLEMKKKERGEIKTCCKIMTMAVSWQFGRIVAAALICHLYGFFSLFLSLSLWLIFMKIKQIWQLFSWLYLCTIDTFSAARFRQIQNDELPLLKNGQYFISIGILGIFFALILSYQKNLPYEFFICCRRKFSLQSVFIETLNV